MAEEGATFVLGLKDQVSGPAKAVKASLWQIANEAKAMKAKFKADSKSTSDAMKQIEKDIAKAAKAEKDRAKALDKQDADLVKRTKLQKAWQEKQEKGSFWNKLKEGMLGNIVAGTLLADVFKKLGETVFELAKGFAELVIDTAKWAIEAGAAKEQSLVMYKYFEGSAKKGQEVFDKIDALGTAIHIPTAKAHEYAKDLLKAGVEGPNRLEQAVKSVAMLQKVAGDDAANKLKGILERTSATQKTEFWKGGRGTFSVTREDLLGTGATIDEVYGALAKKLGKSNAEIKRMMMFGQITAAQGIDALNDVIERGKVGDTARQMVGGLDQVWTEIKDNFGKILREVNFKDFIKEMRGVARMFDPATQHGKDFKNTLVNAFNTVFKVGKAAIRGLRIGYLELAIASLDLVIFLTPQLLLLKKTIKEMKESKQAAGALKFAWAELKVAVYAVAIGLKLMVSGLAGAMWLWSEFSALADTVTSSVIGFFKDTDWKGFGSKMITDLIDGLKEKLSAAVDAGKSIGDSIKKGVKDAIGWHSPPKFFIDAGKASVDAFAKGGEDGAAPTFAKRAPMLGQGGGGGKAVKLDVTLNVEINGVKDAAEAVDAFEERVTNYFNKLAIQLSGGEEPAA